MTHEPSSWVPRDRLAAAAEALPAELDHATKTQLSHTAFLERLLAVEVAAQPGDYADVQEAASHRRPPRRRQIFSAV